MENKYRCDYFFNHVDVKSLKNRIAKYLMTYNRIVSYSDIWTNLGFTIFEHENSYIYNFHPMTSITKGQTLYRARKIPSLDKISELKYDSSYWEKPKDQATEYGRLNVPKENNLYLSDNIATCLYEVDADVDDFVLVSSFSILRTLKLNSLLFETDMKNQMNYLRSINMKLNRNGREAFKIYSKFYSFLFNLPHGHNDIGYKQSNAVAKMFYSMGSNAINDGWFYESHKVRAIGLKSNNICLTPTYAHNDLKLESSVVLKIEKRNENKSIRVNKMALRQPESDKYIYSDDPFFTPKLKEYFGTQLYDNVN